MSEDRDVPVIPIILAIATILVIVLVVGNFQVSWSDTGIVHQLPVKWNGTTWEYDTVISTMHHGNFTYVDGSPPVCVQIGSAYVRSLMDGGTVGVWSNIWGCINVVAP